MKTIAKKKLIEPWRSKETRPYPKSNPSLVYTEVMKGNEIIATINGTGKKTVKLITATPVMYEALKEEEKTRRRDISFITEIEKYIAKHDTAYVKTMLGDWKRELLKRETTINAINIATA